jgi:plasmid stabilization system protein ParE
MNWTVIWKPDAEDDLATLWLNADDKAAISAAANRIDAQLRKDPLTAGESREKNRRILFEVPLGVVYHTDKKGSAVQVLRVWRISSHRE